MTEVWHKGVEEVGDRVVKEINQKLRTRGQLTAATDQIWPTASFVVLFFFFFILMFTKVPV